MKYNKTWLNLEPGRIIEKEFYIEVYPIDREGTGFQRPIYTALDLYKPYYADRFTDFETIIAEKETITRLLLYQPKHLLNSFVLHLQINRLRTCGRMHIYHK